MEKAKDEIIRNYFTKYVETALNRARCDYIKKGKKRSDMEVISEPDLLFLIQLDGRDKEGALSLEMADEISWKPEAVKLYLKESVDDRMLIALSCLTDTELLIVFAKVFRQMTFMDIGDTMGLDWKKVASSYSYARKKMMKGWEKNDV